jgi:hypothetical protein
MESAARFPSFSCPSTLTWHQLNMKPATAAKETRVQQRPSLRAKWLVLTREEVFAAGLGILGLLAPLIDDLSTIN